MRKTLIKINAIAATLLVAATAIFTSCSNSNTNTSKLQAKVDSLEVELKKFTDETALTELRLTRFDSLDFHVYSNQDWDKFSISHSNDIKVVYADGSVTVGNAPQHIDKMKPMFVFAPDTKITSHPVRIGSGDWTAVVGVVEGTFSAPMPISGNKTIPPTNKKFKLSMCTVARWKDGKMIEEQLYFDNQSFMKQIGLAQ